MSAPVPLLIHFLLFPPFSLFALVALFALLLFVLLAFAVSVSFLPFFLKGEYW